MSTLQNSIQRIFENRRFNLIAFALIAALVLLAYSNTFTSSFHFDDDAAILENPAIKNVTVQNVLQLLKTNRPIVNLSLMLNYQLNGLNVVGWHIFNTAVHIANSYFVYLFVSWTLNLPSLKVKYGDKAKRMALFCGLLFALHPIQTESVTYIISRSELLAGFFFLLAFLMFIKGATSAHFSYYVIAFIASLFAMGSKEWAATLPAVLLLYDVVFLSQGKLKNTLTRSKAYVLLFLPWIFMAYILTLYKGVSSAGFSMSGTNGITPTTYLLTSLNVIWTYIRLLFLPINQNLDYDYPLARTLFEFPTILSLLGHVVVVAAAFWLYRKKGWLLVPFGIAWFYTILSPTQSFVPILDLIFEHRIYLPALGIFMAFVAGYEELFDRVQGKQMASAPENTSAEKKRKKIRNRARGRIGGGSAQLPVQQVAVSIA